MKQTYKVSLTSGQHKKILDKARESKLEGRGAFSQFIQKIADEDIIFLDANTKKVISVMAQNGNS